MNDVETQLVQELDRVLVDPVRSLLGMDLGDTLFDRVDARVPMIAAQLSQDEDKRLAAETVTDVLTTIWGSSDPAPEWWRTPVGRLCARSLGTDDSEAVTHSVAAAMLDIQTGSIGSYVARGALERHPDGGVTRASVLLRIAETGRRDR